MDEIKDPEIIKLPRSTVELALKHLRDTLDFAIICAVFSKTALPAGHEALRDTVKCLEDALGAKK